MIFIYNETKLNLALKCESTENATSVAIIDKDRTERSAIITTAGDQTIAEAIVNRYNEGVDITSNLSKEYIMVKDTRILMDPENDTTVRGGKTTDKFETQDKVLVKNMIVLILHKDSKFFVKSNNIVNKAKIVSFGDEYKVVTMYIKTNNWTYLREPMNILIQSGYGFEYNARLDMEAEVVKTSDGNKEYTRNVVKYNSFDGEFPQINKSKKPFNKANNYNNYKDNKNNKNFNTKGNGNNFHTHRNGNRGC